MLESQAFDNAVENVKRATKLAEKHSTDGKADNVAAGLAKANAELEVRLTRDAPTIRGGAHHLPPQAHRRELEAAQAQGQTSAEQLRRAKVEKEVHDVRCWPYRYSSLAQAER